MPCDCECIPKCCDNPLECNGKNCKCKDIEKTVEFESDMDLEPTLH